MRRVLSALVLVLPMTLPSGLLAYCVGGMPNGVVEPGEQCDDGDANDDDCCTNECANPCHDGEFCTFDYCYVLGTGHTCSFAVHLPVGTPCPGPGNPCKPDVCNASGRCGTRLPDGSPCPSDGNACTADVCSSGRCGVAISCDDGNPCTTDACDPATGCTHVALPDNSGCWPAPCHYGICSGGQCTAAYFVCEDHNPCTDDVCTAGGKCQHLARGDGTACQYEDPCIPAGTCAAGSCQATRCTPGVPCLTDGVTCDDHDTCSPASACVGGQCVAQCPAPCPTDGATCDDRNDCTPSSTCAAGVCTGQGCSAGMPCNPCGGTCAANGADCTCVVQ